MSETVVSIEQRVDIPAYKETNDSKSVRIIKEMLEKESDLLGGLDKFVSSGDTVFIKPNVVVPEPPWTGINTDPRVIEALIELLKEANPKKIVVGEHVRWHGPRVFDISGIGEAVRRGGAEVVILDDIKHVKVDIPFGKYETEAKVPETYLDCDVLINVPKMKTHLDTLVTLCLKNLMGMVPSDPYCLAMHQHLPQSIADLYGLFKPKINIVDGIIAHEGQGPMFGTPIPDMNVLLAGSDGVAVDAVASAIMGINPLEAMTTRVASLQRLGTGDLTKIVIKGKGINEVKRSFLRPMENAIGYMRYDGVSYPVEMYAGCTCGGCHGAIREQLDQLALLSDIEEIPMEERRRLIIITGQNAKVPMDLPKDAFVWVLGDCAAEHKDRGLFAAGCPPPPTQELGPECIGVPMTWPVLGRKYKLR